MEALDHVLRPLALGNQLAGLADLLRVSFGRRLLRAPCRRFGVGIKLACLWGHKLSSNVIFIARVTLIFNDGPRKPGAAARC